MLLAESCQVLEEILEVEHRIAVSGEHAQQVEYDMRELEYLIEDLCAELPAAETDLSFYGSNEADQALSEWQNHGREEEKV